MILLNNDAFCFIGGFLWLFKAPGIDDDGYLWNQRRQFDTNVAFEKTIQLDYGR